MAGSNNPFGVYVAEAGAVGFLTVVVLSVMTVGLERLSPGFAVTVIDPVWLVLGGLFCIAAASCNHTRI